MFRTSEKKWEGEGERRVTNTVLAKESRPSVVARACVVERILSRLTRATIETPVNVTRIGWHVTPTSGVIVCADALKTSAACVNAQSVVATRTGKAGTVRLNYNTSGRVIGGKEGGRMFVRNVFTLCDALEDGSGTSVGGEVVFWALFTLSLLFVFGEVSNCTPRARHKTVSRVVSWLTLRCKTSKIFFRLLRKII